MYMWLQLQVEAFSACFSGHCVGRVSYPKGRRTPNGVEYPRTPVYKFSIFIRQKAFCSKFQTFQHSLIFEFVAEDFITQVCWTFLVNLATLSSCPEMRKTLVTSTCAERENKWRGGQNHWWVPSIGKKYSNADEACLAETAVHCVVELVAVIYQL